MSDWQARPLGEVLAQHEPTRVLPDPQVRVRFAGVRWYGAGLFIREERLGAQVKGKVFALKPGALIYNRLFAWKQSFAVVGEEYSGVVVSNEFPQFYVDGEMATAAYVALYCSSPVFADLALGSSTGSAAVSRNRLKEEDFLRLPIELPPVPVQEKIVEVLRPGSDAGFVVCHRARVSSAG